MRGLSTGAAGHSRGGSLAGHLSCKFERVTFFCLLFVSSESGHDLARCTGQLYILIRRNQFKQSKFTVA